MSSDVSETLHKDVFVFFSICSPIFQYLFLRRFFSFCPCGGWFIPFGDSLCETFYIDSCGAFLSPRAACPAALQGLGSYCCLRRLLPQGAPFLLDQKTEVKKSSWLKWRVSQRPWSHIMISGFWWVGFLLRALTRALWCNEMKIKKYHTYHSYFLLNTMFSPSTETFIWSPEPNFPSIISRANSSRR